MITSAHINAALRIRYCQPEWAIVFEVANGTGAGASRYADAVAMNLYPSRGLEIHGFEVKVSRGDWQRELKAPDKSAAIQKFCNRWWIVAPKDMVKREELPPTWGLLEYRDDKLVQAVAAPALDAEDMKKHFVAAMLRRATQADSAVIDELVRKQVAPQIERINQRVENEVDRRTRDMREKLDRVKKIEEAAGISLTDWGATPEIGHAIKAILASGLNETWNGLDSLVKKLRHHADGIESEITTFKSAVPVDTSALTAADAS